MVDTRDLKSLDLKSRIGSSPIGGTILKKEKEMKKSTKICLSIFGITAIVSAITVFVAARKIVGKNHEPFLNDFDLSEDDIASIDGNVKKSEFKFSPNSYAYTPEVNDKNIKVTLASDVCHKSDIDKIVDEIIDKKLDELLEKYKN